VSDLDRRDNFLHLSTSSQILGTLNAFFSKESEVYILRLPYAPIKKDIRWEQAIGKTADEPGGCWDSEGKEGFFPHLYNGLKLGREEVDRAGVWKRGQEGWGVEGWCFEEDRPVVEEE